MYIVPVRYPGTWLEFTPEDAGRDAESLLRTMTAGLAEAAISLGWFEAERSAPTDHSAEWEASSELRREALEMVRARLGGDPFGGDWERENAEAEEVALRLAAERGMVPRGYRNRTVFMHARTFLYALDSIAKALGVLGKMTGVPAGVADALRDWDAMFPTVKAVRDSAHHMEDRARGLGRGEKPLNLKPMNNHIVSGGGTALILDSLFNSRYGTTTASGDFEEIDVTADSLAAAQRVVQSALDAFTWRGPSRLEPNA